MSQPRKRGFVELLQEYSLPLIAGVCVALVYANLAPEGYRALVSERPLLPFTISGHAVTLRFLVNDGFMVLFFGLAAKEITDSMLPGGALNAAQLHVARTVCRRAERLVVALHDESEATQSSIAYLNRLSDYLFVAARFANLRAGTPDVPWTRNG